MQDITLDISVTLTDRKCNFGLSYYPLIELRISRDACHVTGYNLLFAYFCGLQENGFETIDIFTCIQLKIVREEEKRLVSYEIILFTEIVAVS